MERKEYPKERNAKLCITLLMQKKPLAELIHDLEQEMLRLGYSKGSMKFYRRRWQMLLNFAQERGEIYYFERLGIDFVEKYFHIFEKDLNRTLFVSVNLKLYSIPFENCAAP